MKKWLFNDDPNVAVITTKNILSRTMDITRVFHDSVDGMWQFLDSSENITEDDAAIAGLKEVVDLGETINELYTLPLGWSAYDVAPPCHCFNCDSVYCGADCSTIGDVGFFAAA